MFKSILHLAATALAVGCVATMGDVAAAATNEYSYTETDSFNFVTSDGDRVKAVGTVNWYKDGTIIPVYKGTYASAKITMGSRNGFACMRIQWGYLTTTVSAPIAVSVGLSKMSDGWYCKEARAGTSFSIAGVTEKSHTLGSTYLDIGFATYQEPGIIRYKATKKMSYGGN